MFDAQHVTSIPTPYDEVSIRLLHQLHLTDRGDFVLRTLEKPASPVESSTAKLRLILRIPKTP
jgi:hypothetical protein